MRKNRQGGSEDLRDQARRKIVDAANDERQRTNRRLLVSAELSRKHMFMLPPISMSGLQRAVCVCRRKQLVDKSVLELAGFNPTER